MAGTTTSKFRLEGVTEGRKPKLVWCCDHSVDGEHNITVCADERSAWFAAAEISMQYSEQHPDLFADHDAAKRMKLAWVREDFEKVVGIWKDTIQYLDNYIWLDVYELQLQEAVSNG